MTLMHLIRFEMYANCCAYTGMVRLITAGRDIPRTACPGQETMGREGADESTLSTRPTTAHSLCSRLHAYTGRKGKRAAQQDIGAPAQLPHLYAIIDVALVSHNVLDGVVGHELARARLACGKN